MTKSLSDNDGIIKGLLGDSRTISVIGNDRGSGKTTVIREFIKALEDEDVIGISSFGTDRALTDDEIIDSAKVYIKEGTLCATSHSSLAFSDITKEIIKTTGINTPRGEIVIIRALSSGFVYLSGASTIDEAIVIRDLLIDFGAERVLFDGSVNRKSPANPRLSDAVAYAASIKQEHLEGLDMEINPLVLNTHIKEKYFTNDYTRDFISSNRSIMYSNFKKSNLTNAINHCHPPVNEINIKGALQSDFVEKLVHLPDNCKRAISGASVIVADGTKIFINDREYRQLLELVERVTVIEKSRLVGIFVNPLESGYTDKEIDSMMMQFSERFDVPVFDIGRGVYEP